ncbi:MAG: DUF2083 domain-containing protein [Silicimonas sp.]|nr:DUF2083 domain-containing protein [Silicimonas sp.]
MPKSVLAGTRIRDLRTGRGMRQIALAATCGISPSYLNLIEHNRRRIGGALLNRIADALETDPSALSGGAAATMTSALDAAAEAHRDTRPERDRADELVSRFPGWARLIEAQYSEARRLEQIVERLDDRLTHDPFLSASIHTVLSNVTAIRSASAILASGEKVEPEWQARFHRNIYEDSQRLADATETLVEYLDAEDNEGHSGSLPQEDVEYWLTDRNWVVTELEADPGADIEAIVKGSDHLGSDAARHIARQFLRQYAADVFAVPSVPLKEAVAETLDPIRIATRLGVSLPTIFRRLSTLDADLPGDGMPFGLVGCDGSGTLVFRKPIAGFDLPRYGGACPLWPLFQALRQPMTPLQHVLEVSGRDERRFQTCAVSELGHPGGLSGPVVVTGWMLITPMAQIPDHVVSQPVGTSCRICPEADCMARREPTVFLPRYTSGGLP